MCKFIELFTVFALLTAVLSVFLLLPGAREESRAVKSNWPIWSKQILNNKTVTVCGYEYQLFGPIQVYIVANDGSTQLVDGRAFDH